MTTLERRRNEERPGRTDQERPGQTSGPPEGATGGLEAARVEGDALLDAGAAAVERGLSRNSALFLAQTRQQGGE